jgi:hypothetical protein
MYESRTSCSTASPSTRLPSASAGVSSPIAVHEPMSLQPMSQGTTATLADFLHERVVDGVVGHRLERFGFELELVRARAARAGEAFARGLQDRGAVARHLVDRRAGREAEHAGVPEEAPRLHVLARLVERGLLDEPGDTVAVGLDVAVAGLGMRGLDAEGNEPALRRELLRPGHRPGEAGRVLDQVVGGKDEQLRVAAVNLGHAQRGTCDGGGRAATEGLQDERGAHIRRHLAILVARLEEKLAIGDRDHLGNAGQARAAQEGLLEKALPSARRMNGLGCSSRETGQSRDPAPRKESLVPKALNPLMHLEKEGRREPE